MKNNERITNNSNNNSEYMPYRVCPKKPPTSANEKRGATAENYINFLKKDITMNPFEKLVNKLWLDCPDIRKIVDSLNQRDVVDYATYSTLADFVNDVELVIDDLNGRIKPKTNLDKWKDELEVENVAYLYASNDEKCEVCPVGIEECMRLARTGGTTEEECIRIIKQYLNAEVTDDI